VTRVGLPEGAARAWVVAEPIDLSDVLARVGGQGDGAVLLFLGTVRDHNDGRPVRGVHYEAYEEMAVEVLALIAEEARARAGGGSVAVVHRVGELEIGDVSVAIAVSSPHRAEAYAASRYVIEEIKKRLPVWKQERYSDGDRRWLSGHQPEPDREPEEAAARVRGEGEAA
jgi:molybdopterin synthase catalytic subunit